MTRKQRESFSADGAPPGVYIPNMSGTDMRKWKAKLIKGEFARVEIRKSAGSQMVIIVSLSGTPITTNKVYDHSIRAYKKVPCFQDVNVKMSMNGPAHMSFKELNELYLAVSEAKLVLEQLNED
jgi:hypothetical protein